ncbi:hypothetical protein Q7A_1855 [Methylophaga nitratireducenticrescens]|nr:Mu transposase C-terminal domain-containing protein [Methylophaga nitratireducenticrescens]AFI84673.2 hypothetical protein Q7A_1855 [Methylophaga nitratireducenticrescens]
MNITDSLLQVGARCTISAYPFEVAFVSDSGIRLSPEHGGSQRHLNFGTINELIEQGDLEITYTPPTIDEGMLSSLTEKQLQVFNRKLAYVQSVYKNHEHARSQKKIHKTIRQTALEIGDVKPPASSSVAGWVKLWIDGKYDRRVFLPKLKPSRSDINNENPELLVILRKAVNSVYLNRQKNPQSAVMAEIQILIAEYNASHDDQLEIPSKEKLRRFINTMDSYEVSLRRHGRHFTNRRFRAAGISFVAREPLEMVMADGQVMDVVLVRENEDGTFDDIGRPFLTAFIDIRTRVILGFYISLAPFCGATLLRALRNTVVNDSTQPKGIPSKLIIDNGADYQDSGFLKACNKLNILVEACKPRDPNAKALIERFFRTLNTDLIHKLSGTTFSNPTERGDYNSQAMARLTLDDLRHHVETWIEDVYHLRVHRSLERAPIDVWNEESPSCYPNTLSLKDAEILLRDERECTLSKGKIEVHGLQWKCPSLTTWEMTRRRLTKDRKVIVRIDELNLSEVYVATNDEPTNFHKAYSRTPGYTYNLSLYEHKLLKDELKKKRITARMTRMEDRELYEYRLEYYAALGHADDKVAKRKLERLRDLKARRRIKDVEKITTDERSKKSGNKADLTPKPENFTRNAPNPEQDHSKTLPSKQVMPRNKPKSQFEITHINKRAPL